MRGILPRTFNRKDLPLHVNILAYGNSRDIESTRSELVGSLAPPTGRVADRLIGCLEGALDTNGAIRFGHDDGILLCHDVVHVAPARLCEPEAGKPRGVKFHMSSNVRRSHKPAGLFRIGCRGEFSASLDCDRSPFQSRPMNEIIHSM